jgi:hypothetical protein
MFLLSNGTMGLIGTVKSRTSKAYRMRSSIPAVVLAVADRFCVSDLDNLAGEKDTTPIVNIQESVCDDGTPKPGRYTEVRICLVRCLYSGDEIPALQFYQKFFAQIFTSKFHIASEVLDMKGLIQSRLKLGWDLLQGIKPLGASNKRSRAYTQNCRNQRESYLIDATIVRPHVCDGREHSQEKIP